MKDLKSFASFLFSFFKKNVKQLVVILSCALILIVVTTTWNQKQIEKITRNIKQVMEKKNIKEGLFYLEHNRLYYLENDKEELVGMTNLYGWVNGYVDMRDKGEMISIWNHGLTSFKNYNEKGITTSILWTGKKRTYESIGSEQVFIVPSTGKYRIELWGASGGTSVALEDVSTKFGRGAYVSGEIRLFKGTKLYLQVGSKGEDGRVVDDYLRMTAFGYPSVAGRGGYNGGGDGMDDPELSAGGGGGGATDIRLISGTWDNFESLKSRIMVAGAGGGMSRLYDYTGSSYAGTGESGSGGTLKGLDGRVVLPDLSPYGYGSTQTMGYALGMGGNGSWCMSTLNGLGGGAGGYLGSYPGACNSVDWYPPNGAGGGSSYVSGCEGCKAISKTSTETRLEFLDQSVHYSKKEFSNIKMIDGKSQMPGKDENTSIGNIGNGYARIEKVGW